MKKSKMIKSVGETLGEIQGERKIWVDTKFIEKWGRAIDWYFTAPVDRNGFINIEQALKQMLIEAGISIKK